MRSIQLVAPRTLEEREMPQPPDPGQGEITVRIRAVGVCGSDLHWYQDGPDLEFFMDNLVRPDSLGKPVWLSETGMKPCFSLFGEAGQALLYAHVLRAFAARRSWWTGVSFYDLHDDDVPGDCGSGITRPDWSNRPAFLLLQRFIRANP